MAGPPQRNEDRFYRYPKRRVVAVFDDDAQLDAAVRDLSEAGIDSSGINVLSGPDGAGLLDRSGTNHGLRAHEQALNDGHHVIYVPVRDRTDRAKIAGILRAAGGYYFLYFGAWSVEQLPA